MQPDWKRFNFIQNDATWQKRPQPACEDAPICIRQYHSTRYWRMQVGAFCMQFESFSVRLHGLFKCWIFGHMARSIDRHVIRVWGATRPYFTYLLYFRTSALEEIHCVDDGARFRWHLCKYWWLWFLPTVPYCTENYQLFCPLLGSTWCRCF